MDPEPHLCRLCLIPVEPDAVVILNQAVDLIDSIHQLTTVDVIVDLSRQVFICDQCHNTLDVSIRFRTMCLQNDAIFRKMYARHALPSDGASNEYDNLEAEFIPCKVEITTQNDHNLDSEIGAWGNSFNDYDQHYSTQEEGTEVNIDLQVDNQDQEKQPPVKKVRKRSPRKKRKTESNADHQDAKHDEPPSNKDEETGSPPKKVKGPSKPRIYVKVQCQVCGGFFNREHLAQHQLVHMDPSERPKFTCKHCPKQYTYKKDLKAHMEIVHEGTADYSCKECGKTYARKEPLTKHYIAVHTDVRKYECTVCGKKFAHGTDRNYHYKIQHTDLRPYSCQYCEMTFKRGYDLTLHTRTHTGEKPFKCDLCGKTFAKSYNVVIHKKSHQNDELRRAAAEQKAVETMQSFAGAMN
ncbi:zinc finger protein 184 isoform X2 [Aedes albopictus]|uniref:C2h2-type zn-finger protein n=1 Tax=Aedes albopictus TaxID=7160 RepID=A0ABM1Y8J3_AEDAL|nr:zinc finger protein 184-like [Aedes albopictus]